MKKIIEQINQEQMKKKQPNLRVGDTVKVQVKIIEGDKERLQAYSWTIRVRRISFGEGVERIFLLHSPRIEKIEVTKIGDVRRAKLYYLRDRVGKHSKIAQKRKLLIEGETLTVPVAVETAPTASAQPAAPEAIAASASLAPSKKAE